MFLYGFITAAALIMNPPFKPGYLGSINTCTCIACVVLRWLYLEFKVLYLEKAPVIATVIACQFRCFV